jgi:acetamidase/formamidase
MTVHEIPLERRALHGHFSPDLEPVLTIDSGDTIAFAALSSGWRTASGDEFEPRDHDLDAGHALVGPVEVRGARAGGTLEVGIEQVVAGSWGWCAAGGFATPLNDRLGMSDAEGVSVHWELEGGVGRDDQAHEIDLAPFLGVMGMPPAEQGVHSTAPPRPSGGNLDCKELVPGTRLYLPIAVDGALFSAGDGHARQGDGEVSQLAIECPLDRVELTLTLVDTPALEWPVACTPSAWITFGFDEDLDEAAAVALDGMLELMGREHGLDRVEALALASVVVDLRVTQLVNGARGVHAMLPHDAIRLTS